MNYLQAEKISKSYRENPLFESLSLTVEKNQKLALIARNGAGKSSLLRILAREEEPDSGMVNTVQGLTIGYLRQDPLLYDQLEVIEQVLFSLPHLSNAIKNYEEAIYSGDPALLEKSILEMDRLNAWDCESRIKEVLSKLKIGDLTQKVGELSGGQRKRIALATVLVPQPDLLILDEPTNHLDLDMIEWLEEYLGQSFITVLMVTHDRYFLDRVCTEILELNDKTLYRYKGNYQVYLDKRQERIEWDQKQADKAGSAMKKEQEWVHRMPQARGTKPKYRIEAFERLREESKKEYQAEMGDISLMTRRMGKKVLDLYDLSKSYDDLLLFRDFSYKFQRFEKIGMIGPNGIGKSTFLSIITGALQPDSGRIDVGTTIKFGIYRQEGIEFNPEDKVIDVVRKIAEEIDLGPGRSMSASQFLELFLFPRSVQYGQVEKLSGGEKRRLYLLTVLMTNPNFLILDEPTNDLDILTLNVLEDYLLRFAGSVIIVSHDRYFMDKVVDHLFVFEGGGVIRDFPGNYSIYRDHKEVERQQALKIAPPKEKKVKPKTESAKRKFTYKERVEFETLGREIAALEEEKRNIENSLSSGVTPPEELHRMSLRIGEVISLLDEKELRWLELSEVEE
ncbi:MAG: ABC-F family ATP-binding cassette domain-containing protein [Bacteroidales bacterium]|nr:ABC-F family ATP-binding cassette domain-containing protein [Bacteroidales bacterium]